MPLQKHSRDCRKKSSIDIKDLTKEGFEALRADDPFLYYSIPRKNMWCFEFAYTVWKPFLSIHPPLELPADIHRAAMLGKQIDYPMFAPARVKKTNQDSKKMKLDTTIERRTCISFESDPLAENAQMVEMDFDDDTSSLDTADCDVGEDLLLALLAMKMRG